MRSLKHLGQNFLTSSSVIARIIKELNPQKGETIVEIGPGKGALTFKIAPKTSRLICIEKDPRLCQTLNFEIFNKNIKNIEIVNQDILKFRPGNYSLKSYKIYGSLPFNISKRIIMKFLELEDFKPKNMLFIIQKEVAEDYVANPPHSTYLSVYSKLYSNCQKIFNIKKSSFSPIPKVDASLIRFTLKKPSPDSRSKAAFFKQLFNKPRKTVLNNLRSFTKSAETIEKLLTSRLKDLLSKRPEQLSFREMEDLYLMYNTKNSNGKNKKK